MKRLFSIFLVFCFCANIANADMGDDINKFTEQQAKKVDTVVKRSNQCRTGGKCSACQEAIDLSMELAASGAATIGVINFIGAMFGMDSGVSAQQTYKDYMENAVDLEKIGCKRGCKNLCGYIAWKKSNR